MSWSEETVEIPLAGGFSVLVDLADYELVKGREWFAWSAKGGRYYAKSKGVMMHRLLMNAGDGDEVDHRKHHENPKVIDNRRSNLRMATRRQNSYNAGKKGKSSIFKGVYWDAATGKWRAAINPDGKRIYVGRRFQNEGHAALAYDLAAVKHFGDFALTNFPVPGSTNWLYG